MFLAPVPAPMQSSRPIALTRLKEEAARPSNVNCEWSVPVGAGAGLP